MIYTQFSITPLSILPRPPENIGALGEKAGVPCSTSPKYRGKFSKSVPILGWFARKSLIFASPGEKMPEITGIYTGYFVPISSNLRRK
jgi:hypothetical protein